MLRNNAALKSSSFAKLAFLEKLLPASLLQRFIINLPFKNIEKGVLVISLAEKSYRFEGASLGAHAELIIVHPVRAYWLIKTQGELGFAQAYYEGAIDTSSLYQLMDLAFENQTVFEPLLAQGKLSFLKLLEHRKNHNSMVNSRSNISYHYDLGNDFYSLWLDKTMSYSSGIFAHKDDSLFEAQQQKYGKILNDLCIGEDSTVLEIGCGWGGFMEMALEKGAKVTGLTLSEEQKKYAQHRLQQQFLANRFDIKLQDYRLEQQQYDFIVSIEMFEAVGKEYWQQYFATLKRCLKPGGKVAIQVITISDAVVETYQNSVDFIQAYIFPGGLLPSVEQLYLLSTENGFSVEQNFDFGADYARTCQIWKHDFNNHAEILTEKGYDQAFQRLWNYYLDYCTIGFEKGHISVNQLVLSRHGDS
ncbi:SAM-dependent methyltransferase [Thiomicrorhabdus sediminis]|uniref:Class I SAM-dependent methyltransferase n=1 Tax=Thiomicrorhabdus sediminis TaxID=2580412 RepID=A0A4P9K4P5_9GAMM|nr:cyclopropane-fatty-acyl-phospholipid synthase family protein [Thiomicrorhabdus sediminis]QCU89912.1 class I SAM-dependent methyltransferase [Thiomicrorhabdus sediminis]